MDYGNFTTHVLTCYAVGQRDIDLRVGWNSDMIIIRGLGVQKW